MAIGGAGFLLGFTVSIFDPFARALLLETCRSNSSLLTLVLERVTSAGYAFVSADYQLMPPATGHDILGDIRDLWAFVTSGREIIFPSDKDPGTSQSQPFRFKIDADAIAVAGTSSGGLCALLAAMHCDSPRPKAVISMYGMGCNFLVSGNCGGSMPHWADEH